MRISDRRACLLGGDGIHGMLPQLPANRYGWFVVDRAELHGYLLRALDPEAKMLEEREVAFVPLPRGIFA